jgi:hypothetical protein
MKTICSCLQPKFLGQNPFVFPFGDIWFQLLSEETAGVASE